MGSTIDRRTMLKQSASALGMAFSGRQIYRSELGNITIALAGDAMPTRGMRPFEEENYLALVDLIRKALVGVT